MGDHGGRPFAMYIPTGMTILPCLTPQRKIMPGGLTVDLTVEAPLLCVNVDSKLLIFRQVSWRGYFSSFGFSRQFPRNWSRKRSSDQQSSYPKINSLLSTFTLLCSKRSCLTRIFSLTFTFLILSKQSFHFVHYLILHRSKHMPIDIERDYDAAVPQQFLYHFERHLHRYQNGCGAMPQVMETHAG